MPSCKSQKKGYTLDTRVQENPRKLGTSLETQLSSPLKIGQKHDSQKEHINVHLMRWKGSPNTFIQDENLTKRLPDVTLIKGFLMCMIDPT